MFKIFLRDCDTHSCLDTCGAYDILQNDHLEPIQTNSSSHRDGNIEPACRLGYELLHAYNPDGPIAPCMAEIAREMAIAVVNSDFHHHVHSDDDWDDYSPCDEHFDTRYAIGTHAVEYHELRSWDSLDAHSALVSNLYFLAAAAVM